MKYLHRLTLAPALTCALVKTVIGTAFSLLVMNLTSCGTPKNIVYLQDAASFAVMQKNVAGYQFYPALYIMDLSTLYRIP